MGEHSELLSPSGSGLWMICTAMPEALNTSGIENTDNPASLLGTWKHDLSEDKYVGLIDETDKPADMDEFDWQEVLVAVDAAEKGMADMDESFTELRVGFEGWRADCFGTADLAGFSTEKRLVKIKDYKFGRIRVSPENNSQLMIYARAFLEYIEKNYDINPAVAFDTIELAIIQPKVDREEITWSISMADLLDWDDDVLVPAMKTILDGKGKFVTGSHCGEKYCNLSMAGLCPVALNLVDDLLDEMVLEDQKPAARIDMAMMLKLLENEKLIKRSIDAAWGICTSKAMAGEEVEGFKLVRGKGKRAWKDEEEAVKYLKGKIPAAKIHTQKVITGPQAETLLKQAGKLKAARSRNLFDEQIVWNEGGIVLAKNEDPREEQAVQIEVELESFYEDEEVDVDAMFEDLL